MEHRFDVLAKSVSSAVSRREAIWRLGSGLAVGALALLGIGAGDPANCAWCCTTACRNLDPPPRGHEMAVCITECLETGIATGPGGESSAACEALCVGS
ncbi:MAG: hypothetical protein HY657_12255 [Acidobacteria bacterium]|nr:hypothetical protein [Acidobacteriota bacterium]